MNTQTNESVAFTGFSKVIRESILTPIVTHLSSKGIQTSVEELAGVLKLMAITTPTLSVQPIASMIPNSYMPSALPMAAPMVNTVPTALTGLTGFNGMAMPMPLATSKGKKSKTGAPSQAIPDNERCQYQITRGKNKGGRCENRAEQGNVFCGSCKDKKAAKNQLQQGGTMAPSNPMGMLPNMMGGLPQMMSTGMPTFPMPQQPQLNPAMSGPLAAMAPQIAQRPPLRVQNIGNGFYYEVEHNLAIKLGSKSNEYICCGIYDPKTNQITPLTPDKMEICNQKGISYVDPAKVEGPNISGSTLPNVAQQLPTAPQANNTISLPSVGQTLPPMTLPSVGSQFPPLPQMGSSLPNFGSTLPNVPSTLPPMGLPQLGGAMPGMPAVTDVRKADDPDDDDEDDDDKDE